MPPRRNGNGPWRARKYACNGIRTTARPALLLRLWGSVIEGFAKRQLLEVIELTDFVAQQRRVLQVGRAAELLTPRERVYHPSDPALVATLGLDPRGPTVSEPPGDLPKRYC